MAPAGPLGHLRAGKPLAEWFPERPWRFPDLAVAPWANLDPFVLLCPASDLGGEALSAAGWAASAAWLEEWVAPVRLIGGRGDAELVFAL
jgi:hypothetical protein